jgi:hypothetical protein
MSLPNISDYLAEVTHPKIPYTYRLKDNVEQHSYCYVDENLRELYKDLIEKSTYLKTTPQKYMFQHPYLGSPFGLNIDEIPINFKQMIESKINKGTLLAFVPPTTT